MFIQLNVHILSVFNFVFMIPGKNVTMPKNNQKIVTRSRTLLYFMNY